MKYLLVLLVLWVAFAIWRNGRRREEVERAKHQQQPGGALPEPQAMVRCAHCGLHLPAGWREYLMLTGLEVAPYPVRTRLRALYDGARPQAAGQA